jgi:hypothetical protein
VPKNIHSKDFSIFVSSSSMNFFKTLELPHEFLNKDPEDSETTESYQVVRQHVKQLKAVNDVAERGVALITEFNSSITNDEEQKQYLLQIVSQFRKMINEGTKKELVQLISAFLNNFISTLINL